MSDVKKPQAGEWWIHPSGDKLFIIGTDTDGDTVVQAKNGLLSSKGLLLYGGWHHEPDCTGWDWEPPDWVVLGPDEYGWHFPRKDVDQSKCNGGAWHYVSFDFKEDTVAICNKRGFEIRCLRKDLPQPKEEFPQWWTTEDPSTYAFVRRDSESKTMLVHRNGSEEDWGGGQWHADYRTRLTEEQALALLDPPPKVIPIRLWISKDVMKGKLRHMFVYNPDDEHDAILNGCVEIKFDAASQRFVVEGK